MTETIDRKTLKRKKTIPYNFGPEHREYIRACRYNTFNILEGAVRSGKTIDNVFAFAQELMTTPDKIHLATGSTMANAKLNIGDANGFGLEHIFRGQCRWAKYKDNDALIIQGPYTGHRERVVIFAGAAKADSYKKIRGNSFGMWIATEINLHHDNSIKEAFNRQLAARNRKVFWDLNPQHPKAPIYTDYIDLYAKNAAEGKLLGGFNYRHFNIWQNANIPKERLDEITSQYEPGSIWYTRDIEGKRSIAEGLIYTKLAAAIANDSPRFTMGKREAQGAGFQQIIVGVDFGGNGSGHAFVATGILRGYRGIVVLRSERYVEGQRDPDGRRMEEIDPEMLNRLFVRFIHRVLADYGIVTRVYADSAENVLIRGLRNALLADGRGDIKIADALKSKINDRIFATTALAAQGRLWYVAEDCRTWMDAISMAVWDGKKIDLERVDDGSSDIDTLDAFEYTFERDIRKLLNGAAGGQEAQQRGRYAARAGA
ncbi:MAG: hypothetical protein LUD72_00760 [Bacteroidales bacterium]|nr:hypothetical protein [Bacteroidales bacterium]